MLSPEGAVYAVTCIYLCGSCWVTPGCRMESNGFSVQFMEAICCLHWSWHLLVQGARIWSASVRPDKDYTCICLTSLTQWIVYLLSYCWLTHPSKHRIFSGQCQRIITYINLVLYYGNVTTFNFKDKGPPSCVNIGKINNHILTAIIVHIRKTSKCKIMWHICWKPELWNQ
jgi:hypothetical protein